MDLPTENISLSNYFVKNTHLRRVTRLYFIFEVLSKGHYYNWKKRDSSVRENIFTGFRALVSRARHSERLSREITLPQISSLSFSSRINNALRYGLHSLPLLPCRVNDTYKVIRRLEPSTEYSKENTSPRENRLLHSTAE